MSEKIKHVISQQLTTDLVEYEDVSSPGWRFRPCCSSPGLGPMGTCKNLQCHEQLLEGWLQKPSWILTCGPSLNVLSPFSPCFFVFFLIKFGLKRLEMSRWRWSCNKIGQLSWNLWSNSGNNVFFFVPNMVWFPSVTRVYSSMGWLWVYTGTLKSQLHFEMQHNRPNDIVKGK